MKKRLALILSTWLGVAPAFVAMAQTANHAPIMPMAPKDLLACMPMAGPDWTMLQSVASDTYAGGWVITTGVRSFKQKPQPPAPGAQPPPPATIDVRLIDSGYKNDLSNQVIPPKGGGASDGSTSYFDINDCPAQLVTVDDKTLQLHLLVNGRFFFEIKSVNLPEDKLKEFAQSINVTQLQAVSDDGPNKLTNPLLLGRYDEINPQYNGVHPVYFSSPH